MTALARKRGTAPFWLDAIKKGPYPFFGIALAAMLAVSALHQPPAGAQAPRRLALVGGMLLDGYETPPLHHAAVLIEGNKIVQMGPASEVKIPAGTPVVDTSGLTMMPGMIEAHAHLSLIGHGDYARYFTWLEQHKAAFPMERVMEIAAKQLLMAGVTSAIDLSGYLKESPSVRDRIARGDIPGPRMQVSGPPIAHGGGAGAPAGMVTPLSATEIHSPAEAAKATDDHITAGVDVIKAQVPLSFDEYKAIVDAAHKRQVRVHAHVYTEKEVGEALRAGVDVLQHVGAAGTPPYSAELIKAIVDSGRPVVPTAAHRVYVFPATVDFPERLQDPRLKQDFPPDLYAEVQDSLKDFTHLRYFNTTDRQMFFGDASMKQWITTGAVVGMGTDSGTPMNFQFDCLWREAKAFVDHGMAPQRVISALTRVNARIYGKGNEIGTIEPGKLADIIAVYGNPLFDIVALDRVEIVVKDGVVYKGGGTARPALRSASGVPR
jgi:imidazolonepropionase-like amidohydrolase